MNRPKVKIEHGERGWSRAMSYDLNLLQIDFDFYWIIVCLRIDFCLSLLYYIHRSFRFCLLALTL